MLVVAAAENIKEQMEQADLEVEVMLELLCGEGERRLLGLGLEAGWCPLWYPGPALCQGSAWRGGLQGRLTAAVYTGGGAWYCAGA